MSIPSLFEDLANYCREHDCGYLAYRNTPTNFSELNHRGQVFSFSDLYNVPPLVELISLLHGKTFDTEKVEQHLISTHKGIQQAIDVPCFLAGGAVRDLVWNQLTGSSLVPNDYDIYLDIAIDKKGVEVLSKYISFKFPQLVTTKSNFAFEPPVDTLGIITNDNYGPNLNGTINLGTFLINDLNVNLVAVDGYKDHPNIFVENFDAKANMGYVSTQGKVSINPVIETFVNKRYDLNNAFFVSPEFMLARSVRIANKLGIDLNTEHIAKLGERIAIAPPEEDTMFFGWRLYNPTKDGRLRGTRVIWEEAIFTAECSESLKNCRDHLTKGTCLCGIYAFKDKPENSYIVNNSVAALCNPYGLMVEHEWGWRAEKVEIIKLYIYEPMNHYLAPALEARYKVPVELINGPKVLEEIIFKSSPLSVAPPRPSWNY